MSVHIGMTVMPACRFLVHTGDAAQQGLTEPAAGKLNAVGKTIR